MYLPPLPAKERGNYEEAMVGAIAVALLFVAVPHVETQAEPESILRVPADYPTIQAAIDAAFDGDTVLVADGTYMVFQKRNKKPCAKLLC